MQLGLLFISIRCGLNRFYNEIRQSLFQFQPTLEHAAINPAFSLMESHQAKRIKKKYWFM